MLNQTFQALQSLIVLLRTATLFPKSPLYENLFLGRRKPRSPCLSYSWLSFSLRHLPVFFQPFPTINQSLFFFPEKRIGSDLLWERAEKILEDVLKKKKASYKISK